MNGWMDIDGWMDRWMVELLDWQIDDGYLYG